MKKIIQKKNEEIQQEVKIEEKTETKGIRFKRRFKSKKSY